MNYRKPVSVRAGAVLASAMLPLVALAGEQAPVEWTQVAESASQVAFVDAASIEQAEAGLRAVAKINFSQPQPFGKKTFQSAQNTYIMDCAARRVADRENLIFAEADLGGKRISRASRRANNLIWRDAAPGTIDGEILKFACRQHEGAGAPPPAAR
jgi:hypothetical protein